MINVHTFYNFNTGWTTFVFHRPDIVGTVTTFNSDCWENGKPVLRTVESVNYDIVNQQVTIQMEGDDEFRISVDQYERFWANGQCYLGVADSPLEAYACAVGENRRRRRTNFRGWATQSLGFDRPDGSLRDIPIRLERTGISIGRESGSNISYLEEFAWVLDYSTGRLIEGVGTENQLVASS